MISAEQMAPVVEIWANLSIAVKQDEQADKAWGWIQEMYAWSIASTQVEPIVEYELHPELMIQPPWDADLKSSENGKPIYIIHYTYGNDFDLDGRMIPDKIGPWHFDKRDFMVSGKVHIFFFGYFLFSIYLSINQYMCNTSRGVAAIKLIKYQYYVVAQISYCLCFLYCY